MAVTVTVTFGFVSHLVTALGYDISTFLNAGWMHESANV